MDIRKKSEAFIHNSYIDEKTCSSIEKPERENITHI